MQPNYETQYKNGFPSLQVFGDYEKFLKERGFKKFRIWGHLAVNIEMRHLFFRRKKLLKEITVRSPGVLVYVGVRRVGVLGELFDIFD